MFEVEAKVHITNAERKRLAEKLRKMAGSPHKSEKSDTYYADTKQVHIRTRRVDNMTLLTLKNKSVKSSIEANVEMEWVVNQPAKWNRLMRKMGLKPFIRKTKMSDSYNFRSFNIELNYIPGLGHYLEIEKVIEDPKRVEKTQKELIAMFRELGYNQNQFERRYYLDLLEQARK